MEYIKHKVINKDFIKDLKVKRRRVRHFHISYDFLKITVNKIYDYLIKK